MKVKFYKRLILLISGYYLSFFLGNQKQILAQNHSFLVELNQTVIDGNQAPYNNLHPGDTLLLLQGARPLLNIKNLSGNAENPVIITNYQGKVIINTDNYYGIAIQNCRYFRITGTGVDSVKYGIDIQRVASGGGIGIGNASSDFEIDHIHIANTLFSGISAKSDPDCSYTTTRDKFTQYNTLIHDNLIENTGNEALYIGSTKYHGQTINCNGSDTLLYPSLLVNVEVYNNIIINPGWDGIQVSSASENCKIHHNFVQGDSQDMHYGQMSGILIGGGSKCDCYNNYIDNGLGNGIESHGLGDYSIFNNIIRNAGKLYKPGDYTDMKHGIFVTDVSTLADASYSIMNNSIINPKSDGIRFASYISSQNLLVSNLVVNPGNFDFYEQGGFSYHGIDSYIMLPGNQENALISNNFFTRNIDEAIVDTLLFTIKPGSPLIDAGYFFESSLLSFDFFDKIRPYGPAFDIGAFEFNPSLLGDSPIFSRPEQTKVIPNPVNDYLQISAAAFFNQTVDIDLFTSNGSTILKITKLKMSGSYITNPINLESLSSGYYLCRIKSGKVSQTIGFIKK